MRKTIIRTITSTTITSTKIHFEKGVPLLSENPIVVFNGSITPEKALKEIRKEFGETSTVVDITELKNVYEISVEDFLKYGKIVEVKED